MVRKLPDKLARKDSFGKDRKNEDEEEDYGEEKDVKKTRNVASLQHTSEVGSFQNPVAKDGKPRQLSKEGKVAQISSAKKNAVNTKSTRALAMNSTSSFAQSAKKGIANLKKAPEPINAASLVDESVANIAKGPKPRLKDPPNQTFAAAAKPKSAVGKRKSVDDLRIAQNKKKKLENMFDKIYQDLVNATENESNENAPKTIDELIKRAEKIFVRTPSDLVEDKPPTFKQTDAIKKVVSYTDHVASLNKNCGNEPISQCPIWDIGQNTLEILHGLQTMNILLCDIIGGTLATEHQDDADIYKVLSIYLSTFEKVQTINNCHVSLTCIFCIADQTINLSRTHKIKLILIKISK